MRKIILFLGIVLCFSNCNTFDDHFQEKEELYVYRPDNQTQREYQLERVSNNLIIVEDESRFTVDAQTLTVKPKAQTRTLNKSLNVVRTNRLGYVDITVPKNVDVEEYFNTLRASGEYEIVEYNSLGEFVDFNTVTDTEDPESPEEFLGRYPFYPNDFSTTNQWYIDNIRTPYAWEYTTGTPSVKVAVLDSGTDWRHPDLGVGNDGYTNIDHLSAWNFVTNSSNVITSNEHGTLVAGIIGAKTNNSLGISGIAGGNRGRGVTIIPYCIGISAPVGSVIDDAIIAAVDAGARIIQLSLSVVQSAAINAAIDYAIQNNVLIVCASGNDGRSSISYPASHANVLAVGATDKKNKRAYFSNYGTGLDVVAPGVGIYSTSLNNGYLAVDGTSFSAPIVSGIAALLLSRDPSLTWTELRDIIRSSATPQGYTMVNNWNNEVGYGIVDARNAFHVQLRQLSSRMQRFVPRTVFFDGVPERDSYTLMLNIESPGSYYHLREEINTNSFTFIPPLSGDYTLTAHIRTETAQYSTSQGISVQPNFSSISGPPSLGPGEVGTYYLSAAGVGPVDPNALGVFGSIYVPELCKWTCKGGLEIIEQTGTSITVRSTRSITECDNSSTSVELDLSQLFYGFRSTENDLKFSTQIILTAPNTTYFSVTHLTKGQRGTIHAFQVEPISGEYEWHYKVNSPSSPSGTWIPVERIVKNMAIVELPKICDFSVRVTRTIPCGSRTQYIDVNQ